METRQARSLLPFLVAAVLLPSSAFSQTTTELVKLRVSIRRQVTVEMGARVISSSSPSRGTSILVLNSAAQTAKTFTAMAQSLIASNAGVSRVMLLDFPGHGDSGKPNGVRFGDLTMDDYVTALIESLQHLGSLRPDVLLGHGLGAEIIQLAQSRLVSRHQSLRHPFGVKAVILLVPDIPTPLRWAAIDAGAFDPLAALYLRSDPVDGPVLDIERTTWVGLNYGNRAGMIAPGAPTPDEAVANGFIALEPGALVREWIGLPQNPGGPRIPRPSIVPNIFAAEHGTVAGVVTLEQDGPYVFPDEHRALYRSVTGDLGDGLFFAITGQFTVHNVHTINPAIYQDAISDTLEAARRR